RPTPSTSTRRPRTASRYDRVARRVTTMPDRMIDDVVSILERLEEMVETLSNDGRLPFYARDLTRLVAWLRSQPRSRLLVLGGLGAGVLVGVMLLSARRRPGTPGEAPRAMLPEAEPEREQGPP